MGTAVVTIVNPAPGGGTSNPIGFTINTPWSNPPPTILNLVPAEATQYGPTGESIAVRIQGIDFVEDAQAQWNSEDRPTQYISATELEITLTAVDATPVGTGNIMVKNPTPGGGSSNSVPFTMIRFAEGLFLPLVIR